MSNPSVSIDGGATFTTLGGRYRYGGSPLQKVRDAQLKETQNGSRDCYIYSDRRRISIEWLLTPTQLADHGNLDFLITGPATPFYFSLSGVGSADKVLVRWINGYDPVELESPSKDGSTKVSMYRLQVVLEEEFL